MRHYRMILASVGALLVASCVSANVDQITRDTAIIEGRGNAYVGVGDVEREMLKEAALATLNAGYDYFVIESSSSGYRESSSQLTPGYYSSTTTGTIRDFGNYATGSATTQGVYQPPTDIQTSKPRGQMRIRMFRGQVPATTTNAYDARDLMAQYGETAEAAPPAAQPAAPAAQSAAAPATGPAPKERADLEIAFINWCTLAETPTNCGCLSRELAEGPNAISDPELYQLMIWMRVVPGEPLDGVYPNQEKIGGALRSCNIKT